MSDDGFTWGDFAEGLKIGVTGTLKGMGGGGGGSAGVAAQAQAVKNGDISIQLDPENKQIIFSIEEDDTVQPIVFDLLHGTIINANMQATTTAAVVY
jgi:hypothetical protein